LLIDIKSDIETDAEPAEDQHRFYVKGICG